MQHFTKNTVETSEWCRRCGKRTMHQVLLGKLGGCTECMKKQEQEAQDRKQVPAPAEQGSLF